MESISIIIMILTGVVMFVTGWILAKFVGRNKVSEIKKIAENTLREAHREAEAVKKDAQVKTKERLHQIKMKISGEFDEREKRLKQYEGRLTNRERDLRQKMNSHLEKEQKIAQTEKAFVAQQEQLNIKLQQIDQLAQQQTEKLEKVTGLSLEEAKKQFL